MGPLGPRLLGPLGVAGRRRKSRYSLSFDGTGLVDAGTGGQPTHTGSVGAWVKPAAAGSLRAVVSSNSLAADRNGYSLTDSNGGVLFELASGSANQITPPGAYSLTNGTWTYLLATWDGATIRLYADGVQVASLAQTLDATAGTYPTTIGQDAAGLNAYWSGEIDDVLVLTYALTAPQAAALAAGTLDPATLDYSAGGGLWRFEEGSGGTTADSSGNGNTGTLTGGVTWSTDVPTQLQ